MRPELLQDLTIAREVTESLAIYNRTASIFRRTNAAMGRTVRYRTAVSSTNCVQLDERHPVKTTL